MSTNGQAPTAEPRYMACVRELLLRHRHEIKPGRLYTVQVAHDDWCPALRPVPGVCRCEPVATLIEIGGGA